MSYSNTMPKAKIAITVEEETLERIDRLVAEGRFVNRSRAIQEAIQEKLTRLDRVRLARESAKLDPAAERALAEEGMSEDVSRWPAY